MRTEGEIAAVRDFARALMALVKAARMYGATHQRAAAQLNTSWAKLQTVLNDTSTFNLGSSGAMLTFDGVPVGDSPVEKGLADALAKGGVADLQFASHVTFEEYSRFVTAIAEGGKQPGMVLHKLREEIGDSPGAGIQFSDSVGGAGKARSTGMELPGVSLEQILAALTDPKKLMEALIPEGARLPEEDHLNLQEKDIVHLIQFTKLLAEMDNDPSKGEQIKQYMKNLSPAMQAAVHRALAQVAEEGSATGAIEVMRKTAVALAIRHALSTFHTGRLAANEIDGLFGRLSREMGALAPPAEEGETPATKLNHQFWGSAPFEMRKSTLLSSEAWCVPPKQIVPLVRHMLEAGDNENACNILINYAKCIASPNVNTRRLTASGLRQMSELYASSFSEVLEGAFEELTKQIPDEDQADLKKLESDAYIQINKDAGRILKPTPGHLEMHCLTCKVEAATVLALGAMQDSSKTHEVQLYCLKCGDTTLWSSQVPERRSEVGGPGSESKDKRSGRERRQLRRVRMKMAIRVRSEAPGQDFVVVSETIDISKGGAMFGSKRLMPVGLHVKVLMPYDVNADLPETNAKIVRCLERGDHYEIALQFQT